MNDTRLRETTRTCWAAAGGNETDVVSYNLSAYPGLIFAGYSPTQTLTVCKPEKRSRYVVKYELFSPVYLRGVTFWPLLEKHSNAF